MTQATIDTCKLGILCIPERLTWLYKPDKLQPYQGYIVICRWYLDYENLISYGNSFTSRAISATEAFSAHLLYIQYNL